jgi:hypothetical protein
VRGSRGAAAVATAACSCSSITTQQAALALLPQDYVADAQVHQLRELLSAHVVVPIARDLLILRVYDEHSVATLRA